MSVLPGAATDKAILHVESLAARPTMIYLPTPHFAGHVPATERTLVNELLRHGGVDPAILDHKLSAAGPPMIYLPRGDIALHVVCTERAFVHKLLRHYLPFLDTKQFSAGLAVIHLARRDATAHNIKGTNPAVGLPGPTPISAVGTLWAGQSLAFFSRS